MTMIVLVVQVVYLILCFRIGRGKDSFRDKLLKYSAATLVMWALTLILTLGIAKASEKSKTKLKESVVRLEVGSGSIVKGRSDKKYILTNWHVCLYAKYKDKIFSVKENDEVLVGEVVKEDAETDLCAAEVHSTITPLVIAPKVGYGEPVCTRGYPGMMLAESCGRIGPDVRWQFLFAIEETGECDKGLIPIRDPFNNRLRGCLHNATSTTSNLYTRPGASGSPVVNEIGELVGVVSDWQMDRDKDSGMVPLRFIQKFFSDL